MDEKDRPETDLENLLQQSGTRFSIEHDVLAPQGFVERFLASDPPRIENAEIRDVTFDPVDQALTHVTFHIDSHPEGALASLTSKAGFDFRAIRGELDRWKSACQEAYGGVGPLEETERLDRFLRPPD